jgi:hypothetical protein
VQNASLARFRRRRSGALFDEDRIEGAAVRAPAAADAFVFIDGYDVVLTHNGLRLAHLDTRRVFTLLAYDRERFFIEYKPP